MLLPARLYGEMSGFEGLLALEVLVMVAQQPLLKMSRISSLGADAEVARAVTVKAQSITLRAWYVM